MNEPPKFNNLLGLLKAEILPECGNLDPIFINFLFLLFMRGLCESLGRISAFGHVFRLCPSSSFFYIMLYFYISIYYFIYVSFFIERDKYFNIY